MEVSLLVFAAAVVGSAVGPLVVALLNLQTDHKNRMEARRKEMLNYLDGKLQALIELRGDLQWYQQAFGTRDMIDIKSNERREISYGKAYGIIVSIDDDRVRSHASKIMDTEANSEAKLAAIDNAIEQLGKFTMEVLFPK